VALPGAYSPASIALHDMAVVYVEKYLYIEENILIIAEVVTL
jgi:hypothetical protein